MTKDTKLKTEFEIIIYVGWNLNRITWLGFTTWDDYEGLYSILSIEKNHPVFIMEQNNFFFQLM